MTRSNDAAKKRAKGSAAKKVRRGPRGKKPSSIPWRFLLDVELEEAVTAAGEVVGKARESARLAGQMVKQVGENDLLMGELASRMKYVGEAEDALRSAQAALDDGGFWDFRVVAIPPKAYADMLRDHRPTDEQSAEYRESMEAAMVELGIKDQTESVAQLQKVLAFNPETFTRALVGACVRPKLDEGELDLLFDEELSTFDAIDVTALANQCIELHTTVSAQRNR